MIGLLCPLASSFASHRTIPAFESKARKCASLVAPMNTSPPAVAMLPPFGRSANSHSQPSGLGVAKTGTSFPYFGPNLGGLFKCLVVVTPLHDAHRSDECLKFVGVLKNGDY